MHFQCRLLWTVTHEDYTSFFLNSHLKGSRKSLLDYLTSSPIRLIWISNTCTKAPAEAALEAHWAYYTCATPSILVSSEGAIRVKIKSYIALGWKGLKAENRRELFGDLRREGMWWGGHTSRLPAADCWNQASAPRALTFCPRGPQGRVLRLLIL